MTNTQEDMELIVYRWDPDSEEGVFTYELASGKTTRVVLKQPLLSLEEYLEKPILRLDAEAKSAIKEQLQR